MNYASRAGVKLEHALNCFEIDVRGKVCADLGCSTGGFTDCLLQSGAAKVYAVDTGYGVLDWKLRKDPRVVVMERTNALHLTLAEKVDFVSVDVSWTPQKLILPAARALLKPDGSILSLLKPHYEAKNPHLKPEQLVPVVQKVLADLGNMHFILTGIVRSPITGEKGGNTEFVLYYYHV
jgi:23S rRNA (cytidine1920-2'-O)/16S rRNA (cytidine1409-2'-O)-methyltransferase